MRFNQKALEVLFVSCLIVAATTVYVWLRIMVSRR